MELQSASRTLTLRYVYPDGRSVVREHQVWDADRFMHARVDEGRTAEKPEDRFEIEVVNQPRK